MTPEALAPPPGAARIDLQPLGLLSAETAQAAIAAGRAMVLAGGPLAFSMVGISVRDGATLARAIATPGEALAWGGEPVARRLAALSAPRPAFAGLAQAGRPLVMGIVNVTPDSFSDGGAFLDPAQAIAHGEALMAAGADILDVGGESTRPGAAAVTPEAELSRILPVIRDLAGRGAIVSVDTRHAAVMAGALDAGARIVNDVTALAGDPDSLAVVAERRAPAILMHMQGEPRTMQHDPRYDDAPLDIFAWLEARLEACEAAGIDRSQLAVDPGIGFGKTLDHNLALIRSAALFHGLGVPLLYGVSRKSFIGRLADEPDARRRGPGSLAAGLACLEQGVQILRVHDVAETVQATAIAAALMR